MFAIALVPDKNKVEVRYQSSSRGLEILRKTGLLDGAVELIPDDEILIQTATCYGGTGLTGPTAYATVGFVVNDGAQTRRGIVTAAHLEECAAGKDCNGNTVNPPAGCTKNRPVTDDGSGVTYNFVRQVYQTDYDMEFRVPSGTHTLRNEIKYGSSEQYTMPITTTYNPRDYAEGTFSICKQGRTTKYTCGKVDANYAAFSGGMTGTFIRAVNSTAGAAMAGPGDSGGPVFVQNGAVGITVGAGGTKLGNCPNNTYTYLYFQPVANLSALNVTVATTAP